MLSFVIYRLGDNALKKTRKADFEIKVGAQYFAFLTEFLLFLILVADRIAYRRLSEEMRHDFTSILANRVAETHAENESRLMGGDYAECKERFINLLNRRSGEYAEFGYDESGPDFAFTRCLAWCMNTVMNEKDSYWIVDQVMSIEAPEAVENVEKTFHNLLEKKPREARRQNALTVD